MSAHRLLLVLASCVVACSTATQGSTAAPAVAPVDPPQPAPAQATPSHAAPASPQPPTAAADPASWIPPLPSLSLAELTADQQARARACLETHDVRAPDTAPAVLMAAAECLARIPAPGHEIRLYRQLVETAPSAPQALEATRRLGERLEQIDARAPAAAAHASYLRRYPKQADARALGQRAVCLSRSLGDDASVAALLTDLERFYGARGFSRPTDAALEQLCAPLPPLAPRP